MINRTVLVGRLTKDPELRYTPSGVAVAAFTLAVNRSHTNSNGERDADFINCIAWRQLAELCANYLKKGSQAGIDGRLQSRSYDNKEGKRVFVVEVVADNVQFLSPSNRENNVPSGTYGGAPNDPFANDSRMIDIADDDLPF